jgi:hypothetical protein
MGRGKAHGMSTLAARVAALFIARPGEWIDGRVIAQVGGQYAWRTRIADVRREPFNLAIRNRQRRVKTATGENFIVSEYMHVVEVLREERKPAGATSEEIAPALLF